MIDVRITGAVLCVAFTLSAPAAEIEYTQNAPAQALDGNTHIESAEITASRFGLQREDWTRYEEVMKGEGRFHWSQLDPVWVLAIDARTDAERQRYAKLAAKQEYERTRRLLRFKDAYVEAFQQMYGREPIVDLAGMQNRYQKRQMNAAVNARSNPVPSISRPVDSRGDRIVLFMSTNGCPGCDELFMRLTSQQTPGIAMDVYFIGDKESNINAWAKRMGVAPSDIGDGHITLNNSAEMYARYGNPTLPAAYYFDVSANNVLAIKEVASQ